jgi:hypothetical protein
MFDGGFKDGVAAHFDEGGEKAVHAGEELEALEAVSLVKFETAGGILDGFIAEPIADAVGNSGLEASEGAVVALLAPAGDHVVGGAVVTVLEDFEEAGDFFRIVLKIAVDGGDDLPAGGFETGVECSALAPIFYKAQDAKPGVLLLAFCEQRGCLIGAAIVAGDYFEGAANGGEGLIDARKKRGDHLFFVVDGNHQRQIGISIHEGPKIAAAYGF